VDLPAKPASRVANQPYLIPLFCLSLARTMLSTYRKTADAGLETPRGKPIFQPIPFPISVNKIRHMTAKRVLIVDDEPKMQRILALMLTQMGHKPLMAGNGQEALEQMQADSIDLIVSDLQMPVMNGLELLKTLRGQGNDTPCIIITAYGTVETAVDAMKHGACDYIIRPFDMPAVELAINRALALRHIQQENAFLREEAGKGWGEFIGRSPAMRQVYDMIEQVAQSKTNVLIVGETGTGKELVARAVHQASPRCAALFVPINCAAIPGDLLESELFGYAKGAFTGAAKDKPGKFEMAQGGTLFLDEITEMNPLLQAKLLRVLQENVYERLGSNEPMELDARIIAATNRDPLEAVRQQKLREDLYYRIQVFAIELPPLRDRPDDIPQLANHFVHKLAGKLGISAPLGISPEALGHLENYRWPGNVREMENVIERAMVLSRGQLIEARHLPQEITQSANLPAASLAMPQQGEETAGFALEPAVEKLEKQYIAKALKQCGGNKTKAARLLEISERTLWYKLKKYEMN
jgi:two-component system response regulator AtoC